MDLLLNAPASALLGCIIMILICATLLGGYIIFAVYERRKKSQSTLDDLSKTALAEVPGSIDSPGAPTPVSKFSKPLAAVEKPDPANIPKTTSAIDTSSATLFTPQPTPTLEERLSLSILSNKLDMESSSMADTPQTPKQANIETSTNPTLQSQSISQSLEPVELLRLLRDPQSGQLIVEIGGQGYTKLADITDKKIGQFILQLMAHLLVFTNGVIVTGAGIKSVYKPKVGQVPMPVATPPSRSHLSGLTQSSSSESLPVPKTLPETEAAFLASLRASPPQEPKPQKRGLFGRGKSEPEPEPTSSLNLAEEINGIVQTRLRYSSLSQTTQIEITGDPSEGIRIQVNDRFYNNPDDVSEQEVRELIKDSIKEWNRS